MSESNFAQQIASVERRYHDREDHKRQNEVNLSVGGDWRQVETPERVMRRITSLGLDELGGQLIATENVTQAVPSVVKSGEMVSVLERIIEENDLISSRFLPLGTAMSRAVGRITLRQGGRNAGFGTGFMVSPDLLLTNHHVLETSAMAAESFVEFDYFERPDGTTRPTVIYKLNPTKFFLNDPDLDYALVAVAPKSIENLPITNRGFIPLIAESGKVLVGEPVNVIQHPSGEPQQIAIRNNNVTDTIDDFLHYAADTEPGSSGSPVFNMQWELAALHHSGVPKRNNLGQILMTDGQIFDGRQENQQKIAWIANEGVRISSIVADVRAKLASDPDQRRRALFETAIQPRLGTTQPLPFLDSPTPTMPRPAENTSFGEEYSDEQLDRLTPEEISTILSGLERQTLETKPLEVALERTETVLVAEGDSWFDYAPAGLDVIACLKKFYGYSIYNVSQGGDTLDNMAWGTKFDQRSWRREFPQLKETLAAIEQRRPPIVLLSGGGNDVAGEELFSFLNHKTSGLPPLREDYTDFIVKDYFQKVFQHITTEIWKKDPSIHILLHGYGYPIPDGRAVIRILGFSFVGPWLRPPLVAKGYEDRAEQTQIVRELMDKFNLMLAQFAATDARLHYIDLRSLIVDADWENELHLKNSAFRRVAGEFDRVIRSIL